ncbi:MAG: hypothetical protein IAE93_13485 [Ignavibacteria bacterium]|nr:hypothetical protein [Ignavibacteria bacterium]
MQKDPIINLTITIIRNPIDLLYENKLFLAAITLIFASIDTLAGLNTSEHVKYSTRNEFIYWIREYFHLGNTIIKPIEWYATRCSILHSYSSQSSLHEQGGVRKIAWFVKSIGDEVIYKEQISSELIMVDLYAFQKSFYSAMDNFFIDVYKNKHDMIELVEKRLKEIYHSYDEKGIEQIGEDIKKMELENK